jgi:hypothetical protein
MLTQSISAMPQQSGNKAPDEVCNEPSHYKGHLPTNTNIPRSHLKSQYPARDPSTPSNQYGIPRHAIYAGKEDIIPRTVQIRHANGPRADLLRTQHLQL